MGGVAALEQGAAGLADFQRLTRLERVVVGDHDFGFVDVWQHFRGNQLSAAKIGVGITRMQDAQSVLDRNARRYHQKASAVEIAAGHPHGVDRLPGDDHCHDRRFAAARRHLQRDPG
jgi:hypothetical protein